jgi:hypothetical protein
MAARRPAGMVTHAAPPAAKPARRGSAVVPPTRAEAEKEERRAQRARARAGSVKWAWAAVTGAEPGLVAEAIRRGLHSTSPTARLGYLELGAKLNKEIGPQTDVAGGVSVILVGHGAEVMAAWRKAAAAIAPGGDGA